jgi:hypothetical protein
LAQLAISDAVWLWHDVFFAAACKPNGFAGDVGPFGYDRFVPLCTTGSFLYYVPGKDVYIAGSINQTETKFAPFGLIWKALAALK